jgi:hypothetical protein
MNNPISQQRILNLLEGGALTWEALKTLAKINDDSLGFTIGELLGQRKIWTLQKKGVRFYGIERRTGLIARSTHQFRRSADRADVNL